MNSREVLVLVCALPCLVAFLRLESGTARSSIVVSTLVSVLGFFATKAIIPVLKPYNLRSNLYGKDINKKGNAATHVAWSCE